MMLTQSPVNRPDRRHLQRAHTRVNGDDGLGQTVIEPYHTPLLTLSPCSVLKKHAVLRVADDKENKPLSNKTNRGWSQREKARHTKSRLLASTREENEGLSLSQPFEIVSLAKSTPKPVWATPSALSEIQSNLNPGCDQDDFPALVPSSKIPTAALLGLDELSAQSPSQISIGGATECATKHQRDTEDPHPLVSQKKAKKTQREFKRKAKKLGSPDEALDPTTYKEVGPKADDHSSSQILSNTLVAIEASNATGELSHHGSVSPAAVELTNSDEGTSSVVVESQNANFHFPVGITPKEVSYTFHGKHDHWMRFSRIFDVDQLTLPDLKAFESCSHGSSCRFESHGVPDCPFHDPRKRACSCSVHMLTKLFRLRLRRSFAKSVLSGPSWQGNLHCRSVQPSPRREDFDGI
jgi:hypothetical protein